MSASHRYQQQSRKRQREGSKRSTTINSAPLARSASICRSSSHSRDESTKSRPDGTIWCVSSCAYGQGNCRRSISVASRHDSVLFGLRNPNGSLYKRRSGFQSRCEDKVEPT
eukprot:CAMPEP_0119412304 /NCGR_PEP_ID=MMETSP1335-20130426/4789_1 /TAXON_ID=259385 /ORGANISM="Chrysoculter rhomboideus, Strain RCC1486" /LENGTH=111 /DNA_ID=CAMNT_0007437027 /DNA_START=236 /DNA_END=568 /DNA_ORIENTATION=-